MKKYKVAIVSLILIGMFFITLYIQTNKKSRENYVLKLDANVTTNYFWNYELSEEGIVEVVKDEYIEDEKTEEMVGVGGKQIYEFRGIKKGVVIVTLRYQRLNDDDIAETKTITLEVDKNLNVKQND